MSKPRGTGDDSTSQAQFGRFPTAILEGGFLARMKKADMAVYLVIAGHVDKHWTAYPSLTRIADSAGITRMTVCRAIARLKTLGVLRVKSGRGCRETNRYTLVKDLNSNTTVTIRSDEIVTSGALNGNNLTHAMVTSGTHNGNRRVTGTDQEQKEQTSNRKGTAADVVGEKAKSKVSSSTSPAPSNERNRLCEALTAYGITDPKRSTLMGIPGLTPGIVAELAQRTQGAKNPAGKLVTLIEKEAPAMVDKARKEKAVHDLSKAAEREQQAEKKQHREQCDQEYQERQKIMDSLTNEQLEAYHQRVMEEATPGERHRWKKAAPRTHRGLQIRIVELVTRDREKSSRLTTIPVESMLGP